MTVICTLSLFAQTNPPAPIAEQTTSATSPQPPASPETIQVSNAGQAFAALLHFIGFSGIGIVIVGLVFKAGAGYARNYFLKGKTAAEVGPFSRFIAHAAGNSLPGDPPQKVPPA